MRIEIDNKPYQVDEGATYTMNYNETLDSATIRISHLNKELDIEPFDKVKFVTEAFEKNMCIDSWSSTQEGLDKPTYVYNINLVSQTKLLENIVLPNISITPRKIGDKLSIAYYLKQYLSEYAGHTNWHFNETNLNAAFSDECPELQWNMPTLREVFNTLMMVKDKIPVLDDDLITWLDLTEKKGEVSGNINYIQKSQSADDYVSDLRMQMQNVLQSNITGVDNTCDTYEDMTFTTDDYVATTDNIYLKTKFPILNIKHLYLSCYYYDTNNELQKFKVDLCNLDGNGNGVVYEQKEYLILPVLYRTSSIATNVVFTNSVRDYFSKYKNFCIYYSRGDNKILGFTDIQKGAFGNFTNQTYEWIKALAFSKVVDGSDYLYNSINNGYGYEVGDNKNAFFNAFFSIEYETSTSSTFSACKEMKPRNERTVIDHQTNSWVEASSQGFFEYQKANRMGNQILMINQQSKYPAYKETFIQIGQTYKDSIVFQTQYQFYNYHVEVNAYATKNYILQNYFTGIKSKIRTWVNAQNEAFVRNELIKRRCEFSFTNKSDNNLYNYLLSPLNVNSQTFCKPIKYAIIKTSETNNKKYIFDCVTRVIGRSIIFTTGFDDNWVLQKHVNTGKHEYSTFAYEDGQIWYEDIESGYYAGNDTYPPAIQGGLTHCVNSAFGGIPFNYYRYTDDDGEFTDVDIELVDEFSINESNMPHEIVNRFEKPLVKDNDTYSTRISESVAMHKDNKEIPMFNLQYEFCSDDENIVVTDYYAKYQDAVRSVNRPPLKFYYSYDFNRSLRKVSGNKYQLTSGSIGLSDNKISFNVIKPENTVLYVCDNQDNVILIINGNKKTIYLNVLEQRR